MLSEIESEVDGLTRQVSGYQRFGQSTPKYMATGERQSVGFPIDSGFATAQQSSGRANAQRESTEVDRIKVKIEKLREQLGQYEELRSMQECAYREREGSPAVRFKERLYDNYVPPGVTVRQKSDQTKKPAQPAAAKGSNTAHVKAATSWLDYKSHFDACSRINQWSENEKGLYLAVALRGQAQGILVDLPIDKQQDYKSLVKALEQCVVPPNQTELYRVQLTERRQKPAKILPELSQAIRRLVSLAYPTVPENVRDTLAKQHFIKALADSKMRLRIKQSRPQNLNDAIRLAVELETFNRAERRVTEGPLYLRTTAADSTAGKVSDKTKDQTDMMKLMTDMQKRLSDLQRDVNQLKNEKFRPRQFDNIPRFNYGRGKAYGQNYGHGQGYGQNFGRGHGYRQNFGRGQDNRQIEYIVNPQMENSQTDKKSENVGRGRGRARPFSSEVTTKQSSIQGSIGVSSAAQETCMYVETDIHQVKCKLLVDTGATVSIVSNDIYQKIHDVARPTLTSTNQEVLTASGDKLKILGRGNFLMRLDDTKDMVM